MCYQADPKSYKKLLQYQETYGSKFVKNLSVSLNLCPHLAANTSHLSSELEAVQGIHSPKPRYGNKFMIPWMEGFGGPAKFETVGAGVEVGWLGSWLGMDQWFAFFCLAKKTHFWKGVMKNHDK